MKILIVSSEFPPGPGGIGSQAYYLAKELNVLGWDVSVLSPQDYANRQEINEFEQSLLFTHIRLKRYRFWVFNYIARFLNLWSLLESKSYDLVIASGLKSVYLVYFMGFLKKIKWIAIGHGKEFGKNSRLTQRTFSRADAVVCVSQYTQNKMLSRGIKPKKNTVIPNGADEISFQCLQKENIETYRLKKGFSNKKVIITVGNVTDRKGQELVIRSMPKVLSYIPNVHYLMIGLPTEKRKLEKLVIDLKIEGNVHFLGKVKSDELVMYLNMADLFIMTSRHSGDGDFEGYGIAVVEAALCGKPAIVSSNSGLQEAVIDRKTGILVPENDVGAIEKALVELLTNEKALKKMALAAKERALREQTWTHCISNYDRFLKECLE